MVDSYVTLQRGSATHYSKYYAEGVGSTAYLQRCPHGGFHYRQKMGFQPIAFTTAIITSRATTTRRPACIRAIVMNQSYTSESSRSSSQCKCLSSTTVYDG
eukprot:2462269-Pyramimonas_sp.AAC.1